MNRAVMDTVTTASVARAITEALTSTTMLSVFDQVDILQAVRLDSVENCL